MISSLLSPQLTDALGWTILHSLWQGVVFAFLLLASLVLLRKQSAQLRYSVALGFLWIFIATVSFTFFRLYVPSADLASVEVVAVSEDITVDAVLYDQAPLIVNGQPLVVRQINEPTKGFAQRMASYFDQHLPLIVTLYLLGLFFFLLRFLGQLAYLQRLKSYGTSQLPPEWQQRMEALERKMNVRRSVCYLISPLAPGLFTSGWLRPKVFLPEGLLKELKENQLLGMLAHELAHIKHHDYLVNLLQTAATFVFFYHPAAWWINDRINEQREYRCDDLALAATGNHQLYAQTLITLKEKEMKTTSYALAFTGPSGNPGFKGRIYRLFVNRSTTTSLTDTFTVSLVLIFSLLLGVAATDFRHKLFPSSEAAALILTEEEEVASVDYPAGLTKAIIQEDYDRVSCLLKSGVAVNAVDATGNSPLMYAAQHYNQRIFRLLLEYDADFNAFNHQGWSPLAFAVDAGEVKAVDLLLRLGADPNTRIQTSHIRLFSQPSSECSTLEHFSELPLLTYAVGQGNYRVVARLLEDEVNFNASGNKVRHLFTSRFFQENQPLQLDDSRLEKLLATNEGYTKLEYDLSGWTPLMEAVENHEIGMVSVLLNAGADKNAVTSDGRTALQVARKKGFKDVLPLLQ
ncbi:MAG: ankyrin repeat domain-containing protein [Bacteroidota bacterium]